MLKLGAIAIYATFHTAVEIITLSNNGNNSDDNAYKLSSKQMGPLHDNLNDASDDTGDKQILNRLGARQGDLIAYESPNWGCFTALFSYNFGKDSTVSISGGSLVNTDKFTPATDMMNQMSMGLGYKAGAFNVEARYAMADDVSGNLSTGALAKETGSTQYGLAMAYQLHKNVQLVGSITSIDNKKNASYTSASGFKLGKGVDMQQIAVGIAATF